ncbi:MAG: hypothetical protein M5R36_06405 [Deltaproteobacteria bacterium]|nr:hypothetical protein [Deltaproteobacteria bacterium]
MLVRRTIPLLITFVVGAVLILSKLFPVTSSLGEEFSIFFDIIAVFAFILGGGNLVKIHGNKIYRRVPGWGYSLVCLIGFFATLSIGMFKTGTGLAGVERWAAPPTYSGGHFNGIYEYIFKPLAATMFALLAFYVASASYRAFRAKNLEATVLLVAAFIILLGRTFIGTWISFWAGPESGYTLPDLAEWIMNYPNLAGQRAIMIGIALGIVSTSLKIILGIDRGYMGTDAE